MKDKTVIGHLLYTPVPMIDLAIQARALTENLTCDPSMHGMTPNQLSHTSQCWGEGGIFSETFV